MIRPLLALAMLATPAAAATFDTYDLEGETFCSLDLGGGDAVEIAAPQGSRGDVFMMFNGLEGAYQGNEPLRFVITSRGQRRAITGGIDDLSGRPYFNAPQAFLKTLTASFTYQLPLRKPVTLPGLTAANVKQFTACVNQ